MNHMTSQLIRGFLNPGDKKFEPTKYLSVLQFAISILQMYFFINLFDNTTSNITNLPFHQYYFQNEKPTKYLSTSLISRSEDNQFGRLIIRTNGLCLEALAAWADPSNSPFFWSKFVEPKVAVNVNA